MIRDTSIEAYREILEKIPARRRQVAEVIIEIGPCTGGQVADVIRKRRGFVEHSETIRNRITELVDSGYVADSGTGICPITGHNAHLWAWSGTPDRNKSAKKQRRQWFLLVEPSSFYPRIEGYLREEDARRANERHGWELVNVVERG